LVRTFSKVSTYVSDFTTTRGARAAGAIGLINNIPEFYKIATRDGTDAGSMASNIFSARMAAELFATAGETLFGAAGWTGGGIAGLAIGTPGGPPGMAVAGGTFAVGGAALLAPIGRTWASDLAEAVTGVRPSEHASSFIGNGLKALKNTVTGSGPEPLQNGADGMGILLGPEATRNDGSIKLDVLSQRLSETRGNPKATFSPAHAAWQRLQETGIQFGHKFGYEEFKKFYDANPKLQAGFAPPPTFGKPDGDTPAQYAAQSDPDFAKRLQQRQRPATLNVPTAAAEQKPDLGPAQTALRTVLEQSVRAHGNDPKTEIAFEPLPPKAPPAAAPATPTGPVAALKETSPAPPIRIAREAMPVPFEQKVKLGTVVKAEPPAAKM
jgi:hypothetical protein